MTGTLPTKISSPNDGGLRNRRIARHVPMRTPTPIRTCSSKLKNGSLREMMKKELERIKISVWVF